MGFQTIKDCIDFNKEEEERGKEEALKPTVCPDCDWILSENSKGERSCPICGRIWE
jgi:rubrerythrin